MTLRSPASQPPMRRAALMLFLLAALCSAVHAENLSVEPDAFSSGTNISGAFPGVALLAINGSSTGIVRSITSSRATTGARVFGTATGATLWGTTLAGTSGPFLKANFDTPTNFVQIDVIANDTSDVGALLAFDAQGKQIAQAVSGTLSTKGGVASQTLSISRPKADIACIVARGWQDAEGNWQNVVLDHLVTGPITPLAALEITQARFRSGNEIEVMARRHFGIQARNVQLSVTINGTEYFTGGQMRRSNDLDEDPEPLVFNLTRAGVPRFTRNEVITLKAEGIPSSVTPFPSFEDERQMLALLPVVLVPGIAPLSDITGDHAYGGERTWPDLETFLKRQSETLLFCQDALGEGYMLAGEAAEGRTAYPTLYTLTYARNYDSLDQGARALRYLINEIKARTYAGKVNIIAHSKGGLIARRYVVDNPSSPAVNRLFLCTVPNTGSVWAVGGLDAFDLLPDLPLIYDYGNLYPVWPWVRQNERQLFLATPNLALADLNSRKLPAGITYTLLYSASIPTPISVTWSTSAPGTNVGLALGDLLVPAFSQLGEVVYLAAPSVPVSSGLIPAFQGVVMERVNIPGIHMSYVAGNPGVHQALFTRLTSDLR